jgi:PAS domain S-box-containing protein
MSDAKATPLEGRSADASGRGDSHRRFIELLHGLNAVVWEMDARTWRFTHVSPHAERVFGYPVTRWLEEPTFWQDELLHVDDREWCVSYCSIASNECRNHAFLYRARTADGRTVWVKDIVRVIPDAEGRPATMRGVMLDVTDDVAEGRYLRSAAIDYDAPELEEMRAVLAA